MNCARTDLGGGRSAMGVPTATEFKFFNQLEGRMCTMCGAGDQRKSRDNQSEHAELNVLACRRYASVISFAKLVIGEAILRR